MTRALVVDDAADLRFLIREVLERAGMEVAEAESGADALHTLAIAARPDVVVLDVQMPDMDGWETLAAIRKMPGIADVPVIMCTVKSQPADALRAWELGCDAYLAKPFDIRELAAATASAATRTDEERARHRARGLSVALNAMRLT
jgi:CheY-like chemotaxis protein